MISYSCPEALCAIQKHMYESKIHSDVQLSAGANGKKIEAHKAVLSSVSDYFKRLFDESFSEAIQSAVIIHDIDSDTLEAVLKFIYCGSVEMKSPEIATKLLKSANLMALPQLLQICEDYLISHVSTENCLEMFFQTKLISNENILNRTKELIAREFKGVSQKDYFKHLNKDPLVQLITELDKLVREDDIAEAVLTWIYVDKKRFMHFQELLQLIKIESIETDTIIQELLGNCTTKEDYGIILNVLKKRNCLIKSIANNSKPQTLIACVDSYCKYLCLEYNFTTKIFEEKRRTKDDCFGDVLGLWEEIILLKKHNELICYNINSKTNVSSLIEKDDDMHPRASSKIGDNIYFLFKKQLHKWNLVNNSMENIVPPEQLNCYKFEAMCELNGEIKIFAYLKRKRRCIEILTYNPLNNFWSMAAAVSNIVHDDFKWFSIFVAHKNCLCYFTKNKLHMFNLSDRKWSYIEHNQKVLRNNIRNIVSVEDKLIVLTWKGLYEYVEDQGHLKEINCSNLTFRRIKGIFLG